MARELEEIARRDGNLFMYMALHDRGVVARTAKDLGIKINYTECKRLARTYFSNGFINYIAVKPTETLSEYLNRTMV